jgi:hypothetical protein
MAMCQIDEKAPIFPYLVDRGTTTADDLLHFITKAKEHKYLSCGDFLIMDNCRVHTASYIQDRLMELAEEIGFRIVFLPAYSPELNPIEFLFGIIKNKVRALLHDGSNFMDVVARGFGSILPRTVENCYYHTILKNKRK